MKTGKTLQELATELQRQSESKRDFLCRTDSLDFKTKEGGKSSLYLNKSNGQNFPISDYTHGQISTHIEIPKKYYDKMRESSPELLDVNVNHWFQQSPEKRLVRTMDGNVRAFLSDRFRPYDNYEIAEQTLNAFQQADCEVISSEITEKKFYLKAVSKKISSAIGINDIVQSGVVISNSEIGAGSLKVEPLLFRLVCLNGLIVADASFRKNHIGKAIGNDLGDNFIEILADDTRRASDHAVLLQIRDIVQNVLTDEGFKRVVEKFHAAKSDVITQDPFQTIELVSKRFNLGEQESKGILSHLLAGRELNRFGLINATTRYSQDIENYDRATEMEKLGGEILELSPSEWKSVAIA